LEGWLKITVEPDRVFKTPTDPDGFDRQSLTQDDLVGGLGTKDPGNRFVCNGQLSKAVQDHFDQAIAPQVGMKMEVVQRDYLLESPVKAWLGNGPLYLVFQRKDAKFSHVNVVYGWVRGGEDEGMKLLVMDPAETKEKGGGLWARPLSFWDDCKMQVGYPSEGGFLSWVPGGGS
jgi:hypothetical protein